MVEGHVALVQPVGSKWVADRDDIPWGPSTIRAELARLEEVGLLEHPHTSAGRVPTDSGYRYYVDELLVEGPPLSRAAGGAHRHAPRGGRGDAATTEQLSQVTNLLALGQRAADRDEHDPPGGGVPPPAAGADDRGHHVHGRGYEAGDPVREDPLDPAVAWAGSYSNEVLGGMDVGARCSAWKLSDPGLDEAGAFLATLAPVFTELEDTAGDTCSSTAPRGCCPSTASRSCPSSAT